MRHYRGPVTRLGVSAVVLLVPALACAPAAPAPAAAALPPPVAPGPPVATAVATTAAPAAPPKLELRPVVLKALSPAPHLEIKFPFAEQRIPSEKAQGYAIRLKVDGLAHAGSAARVVLALDHHRPRPLADLGTPPRLVALLPVTQALEPGPHWLHAAVVDDQGRAVRAETPASRAPFAAVRFWVGDRGERGPPEPRILLLEPAGTYNGADVPVWVDFLPLYAPDGTSALVRVRGEGGREGEARLDGRAAAELVALPSGDYDVEVSLTGPSGTPLARAERTITVNRDLGSGD